MTDPYTPPPHGHQPGTWHAPGFAPQPGYGGPQPALPPPPAGAYHGPYGAEVLPPGVPASAGYAPPFPAVYAEPPGVFPPYEEAPVWPPAANWFARVGAHLIDLLICGVLYAVLFYGGLGLTITAIDAAGIPEDQEPAIGIPFMLLSLAIALFAVFSYSWLPHARSGRTLGKRVFGLKVISVKTGQPPTLGRAAARQLLQLILHSLSAATCLALLIDALWPLWNEPYRQALHDLAVGTRVVKVRGAGAAPPPGYPGAAGY